MGNDILSKTMEYLTSSVENDKVTNINKLTLAINELENFPMTFDMLDDSRVGQILQSIRHSAEINIFIQERIRSLIKCWRQLLNENVFSVIPSQIKSSLSKTPAVRHGCTNGYVLEESSIKNDEDHSVIHKRKSPSPEIQSNMSTGNELSSRNIFTSLRTDNDLFPQAKSVAKPNIQIRKPKVKSTKELLADFSHFIETDIKDKILTDKINQEADDQLSYFPEDFPVQEMFQVSIFRDENHRNPMLYEANHLENDEEDCSPPFPTEDCGPSLSNCERLLRQFTNMCSNRPQLIVTQMVPWDNMAHGLPLPAPVYKPFRKRIRPKKTPKKETPLSLDVINGLLENFEVRDKQKRLISEAIEARRQNVTVVNNTKSLEEAPLKMKLKLPIVGTKKVRRKKKHKKVRKLAKVKVIKERVRRPRKPRVKPMPPITNYLDDMPLLPSLEGDISVPEIEEDERVVVVFNDDNVRQLAYGIIDGHTCTRHNGTGERVLLTSMYSHIIHNHYLHIFPWVDLITQSRCTFPPQSAQLLHSIADISHFYP